MHIHNTKGKNDHLPFGGGELALAKYFYPANKQNYRVVYETKTVTGLKVTVASKDILSMYESR